MSDHQDQRIDDDLVRALGREIMRINRRRVVTPRGGSLDQSAYRILWALHEVGPLPLGRLSEELQLEQSTMSRQVKAAMEHDLVEKESPATRGGNLRPTGHGAQQYATERVLRIERFRAALQTLGRDEAETLATLLATLNNELDVANQAD